MVCLKSTMGGIKHAFFSCKLYMYTLLQVGGLVPNLFLLESYFYISAQNWSNKLPSVITISCICIPMSCRTLHWIELRKLATVPVVVAVALNSWRKSPLDHGCSLWFLRGAKANNLLPIGCRILMLIVRP